MAAQMASPEKVGRPVGGVKMEEAASEDIDAEAQDLLQCPAGLLLKDVNNEIRLGFVRKVYGLLSAQLILTFLIAAPMHGMSNTWRANNSWLLYVSLVMTLVTVCSMACCQSVVRNYPTNYFILFGFTIFEAVVIGFVSAAYTWQSVLVCVGFTAGIFVALSIFAHCTKVDFTGAGPYLFAGLLTLLGYGFMVGILAACGVPFKGAMVLYDLIAILIFVFYIVYDTQMIIGGTHKKHQFSIDDYVFAALNLYLDIIQLFLHLLRLLGDKR